MHLAYPVNRLLDNRLQFKRLRTIAENLPCEHSVIEGDEFNIMMDTTQFSETSTKLAVILRQLCHEGSELLPNWSSLVETAFVLTDSLANSLCVDPKEKAEWEKLAVDLWNKTSIVKSKGKLQSQIYAKRRLVRHISFQVVAFFNESISEDRALKKQILMGLKATRGWIDCKEVEFADKVLNISNLTLKRLQLLVAEQNNTSVMPHVLENEKAELDLNLFRVLCMKAEVRFCQSLYDEAISAVNRAKEMLSKFPNETAYLTMLCYNFGVDCYQEKDFEHCVLWLRESYTLGKDSSDISHKTQARTLRLLANSYIEWKCDGWQENALNSVSLSIKEHAHSAGIYLRLQLLLMTRETASCIKQALDDLIHHQDCNIDLALNAVQLFKRHQRPELLFDLRHIIIKKFDMHPDNGHLFVNLLDLFLDSSEIHYAKTFAEECINGHNTGQRLDADTIKQFHIQFWKKAAYYFENQSYSEALTWYNYSLSLYPSLCQSEANLGKLHRNLATCYLHLGQMEKALSAVEISEKCESKNPHTYFMLFKVALAMNDAEKALTSLQKLVECVPESNKDEDSKIICLAAQMALEQDKTDLAIPALECLISHDKEDKRVVTALRCLLRLLVTKTDQDKLTGMKTILIHTRTAYNKLLTAQDKGAIPAAGIQDEALWFMKLAWNLALQAKDDPFCMKEFFNLCFQLLSLCVPDVQNYSRHQNCLLMSCAACLQLARETKDQNNLQSLLEEVLVHIDEYRQAEKRNQNTVWAQEGPVKTSSSADMFLLIYEFEALTKLKDQRSESVLERAFSLPILDPKLFHTLAALAMDPPANNRRLSMRALKVAIRQHLQMDNPDFIKCSADVRNLIELSMSGNEDEALGYFKETFEMIERRAKDKYPEIEILWLMTKSWNYGLHLYNCGKFQESEQWCGMSMRFLKYLSSVKDDYEEQMTSLYQEIMNCLDRQSALVNVDK